MNAKISSVDTNKIKFKKYINIDKLYFFKRIILIQKRAFDISFSIVTLIFLLPIFLIISILIKVKSPTAPIFFKQKRLGLNGKFFYIYKFRTMVPDAENVLKELLSTNPVLKEEFEKDFKLKTDPRIISGIGSFLRKSSLDELPQFLNAFKGELSIVGPRPIVNAELSLYGEFANKLHTIKPGITGLWQVSGRNDISYDERVALDMQYIDTKSFIGDVKIILYTVKGMLSKDGI